MEVKTGSHYTADEIMAIIDRAADRGVTNIGIPGFKVEWAVSPHQRATQSQHTHNTPTTQKEDLGRWVIPLGKDLRGRMLKEVPRAQLVGFGEYLLRDSEEGNSLSEPAKEYLEKVDKYLRQAGG